MGRQTITVPRRIRIKKGDEVIVVAGNDRDETGRVLEVLPDVGKVIVEGVNERKRAFRPGSNPRYPDGGVHDITLPIDVSNVMLIDPDDGAPTRIGIRYEIDAEGNRRRIRYAKRSGKDLD